MKKITTLFLTLTMFLFCNLFLFSCLDNGIDNKASTIQTTGCAHLWNNATCTAPKTCTKCGTTQGVALGHTTNSGTCLRCYETFETKIWEIAYYVDEFNNPTNEAYMRNSKVFVGTFSNSATTNSKLYARILIDSDSTAIVLYEYGSQQVKGYSTISYDITILDDYNQKHYTTANLYKNGDRLYFSDNTFISLLQMNNKLKIYIEENSQYGYNSKYSFEVENGNFNTELSKIFV